MTDITRRDAVIGSAVSVAAAGGLATAAAANQPHMQAAQQYLESAKVELEKAAHNKGGHRLRAIDLVNQAIEEVKLGRQAARS